MRLFRRVYRVCPSREDVYGWGVDWIERHLLHSIASEPYKLFYLRKPRPDFTILFSDQTVAIARFISDIFHTFKKKKYKKGHLQVYLTLSSTSNRLSWIWIQPNIWTTSAVSFDHICRSSGRIFNQINSLRGFSCLVLATVAFRNRQTANSKIKFSTGKVLGRTAIWRKRKSDTRKKTNKNEMEEEKQEKVNPLIIDIKTRK